MVCGKNTILTCLMFKLRPLKIICIVLPPLEFGSSKLQEKNFENGFLIEVLRNIFTFTLICIDWNIVTLITRKLFFNW